MGVMATGKIGIIRTSLYGAQTITIHWKKQTLITGIVLVWDWKHYRAYKWIWTEIDWVTDLTQIVSWWNQITLRSAQIVFGEVAIDWNKISEHYQMN